MTNREALEVIDLNTDYKDYSNGTINKVNQAFEVLENSIDRLEQLEKENQAYKNVILEVIDLLEIEGKGTKQKAKERLMGLL